MKSKLLKLSLYALIVSAMVLFLPLQAIAHSGRTDAAGGHHDNKNKSGLGSYHYHCGGHPAHLHANGVCPYETNAINTATTKAPSATKVPVTTNVIFAATATSQNTSVPKTFNVAMPASAFNDDRDISSPNNQNDWTWLYIILAGFTVAIIALPVSRHIRKKITQNVNELVEKRVSDLRHQFYSNLFSRHTPKELALVPNDIYFRKDGLPIEIGKPHDDYGKFLVYISNHGNCFHKKCGCSNAFTESHLFAELQRRPPCSRCVKENTYEYSGLPKWYTEYHEYKELQEKYASHVRNFL